MIAQDNFCKTTDAIIRYSGFQALREKIPSDSVRRILILQPVRKIPRVAPKAYVYVKQVLDFCFHNAHSLGFTARLEKQFADRFGQEYGIAHANGTCTMQSALMAADVGVGDEVIVPAYTVYSTAAVALHVGAVPIIADVDPETWTISVDDIRRKLTPRTKAVIPVSICGMMCDMDPIMDLARQHNITVIEDNAQGILAWYKGKVSGSIGHFASFSFQASKTLTCGDGGMLICSGEDLATKARKAATLGYASLSGRAGSTMISEEQRCHPTFARHDSIGWNQRLSEIGCAVALAELERIEQLDEMRKLCGKIWSQVVADCDWLVSQKTPDEYVNAYWTYAARITRDDLDWAAFLRKFKELGGDGFYGAYRPLHLEPVFANLNREVKNNPARYPQWAGRLPEYAAGYCPAWEKIQPLIVQLKTNYFSSDEPCRQAEILAKTIKHFD